MRKFKTGIIGVSSAAISLCVAYCNYVALENFSGAVRLFSIVLCALAVGVCQGVFVQRAEHKAVGMGAFFGLLTLWLPVIVVTYGFALMALPLLAAFAMLVFYGARVGANLRVTSCRSA
jgi:hypothetical protein